MSNHRPAFNKEDEQPWVDVLKLLGCTDIAPASETFDLQFATDMKAISPKGHAIGLALRTRYRVSPRDPRRQAYTPEQLKAFQREITITYQRHDGHDCEWPKLFGERYDYFVSPTHILYGWAERPGAPIDSFALLDIFRLREAILNEIVPYHVIDGKGAAMEAFAIISLDEVKALAPKALTAWRRWFLCFKCGGANCEPGSHDLDDDPVL